MNKTKTLHRQIFRRNEFIGHSFISNLNARIMNETGGYFVSTNSNGFRSDVQFGKKKNGKKRILFFGDSLTAGDGVDNSQRFTDLIGKNLSAEVYNYAISGTGTDQQYLAWKKYAKEVEADLIVLCIFVENIDRNKVKYRQSINPYSGDKTLIPKPYYEIINDGLRLRKKHLKDFNQESEAKISQNDIQWITPPKKVKLFKLLNYIRSKEFYKYLKQKAEPLIRLIRRFIVKYFFRPYKDYDNEASYGYQLMYKILDKFIKDIKDIPVIVMPIPTFQHYYDGAYPNYNKLFDNLKNNNPKIIQANLLTHLNKYNFNERKNFCFRNDKTHFSEYGHRIIEKYLRDIITDNNVIPSLEQKFDNKMTKLHEQKKPIYILGVSAFYHDSAAAIIKDGEIIAACQEERFSRIKNDKSFPIYAINYCLEEARINQNELSAIIFYDNTFITMERMLWTYAKTYPKSQKSWIKSLPAWVKYRLSIKSLIKEKVMYNGKIFQNAHHRSHCAAAFYPSPFREAAIITIDGVGEWATASIGIGKDNDITILKEITYPNSLGILYSAFTDFIGFKVNSGEYKMMGLAPYGEPRFVDIILNNIIELNDDGSFKINQDYFDYMGGSKMTNNKFAKLFGGEARVPESEITQREMDLAKSIQVVTEKVISNMAKYVKSLTGLNYLCLAGGVALNCVANGKLIKSSLFKDIWIQPAAGDAGSALGCALDFYHTYYSGPRNYNKSSLQGGSYWGPEWSSQEIEAYLESVDAPYERITIENRAKLIAQFIDSGNVVGHYYGRTEFGPRALGARSIIGDPRSPKMQSKINLKIKYRESFRPFAPSVLIERCKEYFDLDFPSPYMLLVAPVVEESRINTDKEKSNDIIDIVNQVRSDIPAITHVDYSARIQTVDKVHHEQYYNVISSFEKLTGYGVIVNTSFNVRGEPIVNSPFDAYQCFLKTEMDILVLGNFLISKKDIIKNNKEPNAIIRKEIGISYQKKNDHILDNELTSIYQNEMALIKDEIKNLDLHMESGRWMDVNSFYNDKNVFDMSYEDDKKSLNPKDYTNVITKRWYSSELKSYYFPIIEKLVRLSKMYKLKEENNPNVSDRIYEMF